MTSTVTEKNVILKMLSNYLKLINGGFDKFLKGFYTEMDFFQAIFQFMSILGKLISIFSSDGVSLWTILVHSPKNELNFENKQKIFK